MFEELKFHKTGVYLLKMLQQLEPQSHSGFSQFGASGVLFVLCRVNLFGKDHR